ncbi:MAG TPA: hypothetical protein DD706_23830 [Nitrospiraceae bacterium]|nr:hypothetical protein [Nitrospiraceae bacterium]
MLQVEVSRLTEVNQGRRCLMVNRWFPMVIDWLPAHGNGGSLGSVISLWSVSFLAKRSFDNLNPRQVETKTKAKFRPP